jgi:hypothetical protein
MAKLKVAIVIGQKYYQRMINPEAMKSLGEFAEIVHHPGVTRPPKRVDTTAARCGCLFYKLEVAQLTQMWLLLRQD